MSSSSSSDYSDENLEAMQPIAANSSAPHLDQVVELAQICSFCTTFRQPLRLPSFSRTDLQEAILSAPNGDMTHVELLAELHFKLAREHPTAKMEKMVQDWEKTLARKLQDNWRKEFAANPMASGVTYGDLAVFERVRILDALCHWKLDTCAEIQKFVATLQKENDNEAIERLRAGEIGTDDKGVSYWYHHDGCWVYAENKPRWQLEERKQSYMVEFASAKRIRLSINFDPDQKFTASPFRLPVKIVNFADIIGVKDAKKEATMQSPSKLKTYHGGVSFETDKMESGRVASEVIKTEKKELKDGHLPTVRSVVFLKQEASSAEEALTAKTMDIKALCTSVSPSGDERDWNREPLPVGFRQSNDLNGLLQKCHGEIVNKSEREAHRCIADEGARFCDESKKERLDLHEKTGVVRSSRKEVFGKTHDNIRDQTHSCVVAVVGSKKRTIVDDDSSDSSSSEVETVERSTGVKLDRQASASLPLRKKRKISFETNSTAETVCAEVCKDELSTLVNESTILQVSARDTVVVEANTALIMANSGTTVVKDRISPSKSRIDDKFIKESSLPVSKRKEIKVALNGIDSSTTEAKKTKDAAREAKLLSSALKSPTDPDAAPEMFDITCESCKKCYDMRYVDPPLVEHPTEEWRCFECLVNDARGWPRRRKSAPRNTFSPRGNDISSRKQSFMSKSRSGSSSLKSTGKGSIKSHSGSSSKAKSSHSNSSKRKSSSSRSSASKKSSSSRKHKKRKSSSSSHHHHSSRGHRRRHHSHYYRAEFARLVALFRERHEQRLGIEEARISGNLHVAYDDAPIGWRVVSSTLDELQALIESLSGGSLEQDRLRGRLILIFKDQERSDEQRRKQQELTWNILPRRQSSRIAIGRMKYQSAHELDVENKFSEDDGESRRLRSRSRRSHSATSDGLDEKQKHARAWRARRRHNGSDDEEDEVDDGTVAGDWIDWSLVKCNIRTLSTVCLALVSRLLKEEAADLFSRPVSPDLDGCPNYLSVITHPMDLGTIRSRVESNFYRKWKLFKEDIELVWQNCRTFNAPDTLVVQFANQLSKLSRSMCIAAEKQGVHRIKDGGDKNDSDNHLSDVSKAESHSSINKAWTESSASESSGSSDGNSSSAGDSDSNIRKRRNTRTSSEKSSTRTRCSRSIRTRSPAHHQSSRSRSARGYIAPCTSSEGETLTYENDKVMSLARKNRRPVEKLLLTGIDQVEPATEDEDSSGGDSAIGQNGISSLSPPPPPPPQVAQKRPKPRLIISDSSSSDDSSGSGNSSTSLSSDSGDSDSDARPVTKQLHPPPLSAAEASVPAPPPLTPPPAALPVARRPLVQESLNQKVKLKSEASQDRKKTTPSAAKADASSPLTHSPPMLNSYLSPSSSSSSDLSSNDSDSSDGDSESD